MRIAFEPRAERHSGQALRKAASAVGTTALRFGILFAATEAFLGSGELFTDARVFAGTLAMSQAKDMWTPMDGIIGGAFATIETAGMAYVDHISKKGLQEGDRDMWKYPGFYRHSGTIGTAALTTMWLGFATGMTTLALAQ